MTTHTPPTATTQGLLLLLLSLLLHVLGLHLFKFQPVYMKLRCTNFNAVCKSIPVHLACAASPPILLSRSLALFEIESFSLAFVIVVFI